MKTLKIIGRIIKYLVALFLFQVVGVLIAYGICINRSHPYQRDLTPGLVNFLDIKDKYQREELKFMSEDHELSAYFYDSDKTDEYLVVTCHGFADKSDYLLPHQLYFYNEGFDVFSFDMSGCGESMGNFDGFSQSLIDCDFALRFLESNPRFKNYKKFLFGFSAGGYGVTSVLALHKDIKAVASVSGYNNAKTLVVAKGKQYTGPIVYLGKPVIDMLQYIKFKDYLDITAEDAINSCDVAVFLAHGTNDKLIIYNTLSTAHNFENSNRVKLYLEDAEHSPILFSKEAREYKIMCDKKIKKLHGKAKKDYIASIDDLKYSEINLPLMEEIKDFYNQHK